ncbi:thiamine-phosphate pyrophosphorylase [Limnochorda pilosa]|uniref:Thiamine-phosphate synthase n=1 Tax=Limnochorda pilosa TaxID=1555112 RepID=A0A0K2SK77_LIMPI|nr:thiamine-phosphate pyrophosphorylase [Limnochorda pilosa]
MVTDRGLSRGRSEVEVVREALAGGATAIQLRGKELSGRELYEVGLDLRQATRQAGALLFVDDRLDVALAIGADGVHLGQEDLPLADARRLAGSELLIGITAETVEQAVEAERGGADYLGTRAVFATPTKAYREPIGIELLAEMVRAVSIPVVAIGGIKASNAREVLATGVSGLAVVSAVVAAEDVRAAAAELEEIVAAERRWVGGAG